MEIAIGVVVVEKVFWDGGAALFFVAGNPGRARRIGHARRSHLSCPITLEPLVFTEVAGG